jgi:hypothetical protein
MREKLLKWLEENGIRPATFARDNDLKYTTVDDIIKGRTNEDKVGVATAMRIAEGMETTVEELYGKAAPPRQDNQIIRLYYTLNEEGREKLLEQADLLVGSGKYKKRDPAELVEREA